MTSDSTNSNSGADNNVLTKFQPMPKRYMVWDKETKYFWYDFGGQILPEHITLTGHILSNPELLEEKNV